MRRTSELKHEALLDALAMHPDPTILRSDQDTEYLSCNYQLTCDRYEITLICSARASPWQNRFTERYFGSIKSELGK